MKTIKKYKWLILILLIILLVTMYSCFQTFIINDDLPYSFYHRTSTRVTSLKQVINNQITDYFKINSRVIVHCVVQSLLIYGKKLWSILNPIAIIISLFFMYKIVKLFIKDRSNSLSMIMISALFMMMISYKQIIYWVAGSVNYVWTGSYLLFLLYLYLKHGYSKKEWLNILLIFSVSILHEALLVFCIVFVLLTYIDESLRKKKIIHIKILYFIPLIINYFILMRAPSNIIRIHSNVEWESMGLFDKMMTSLPVVSHKFIGLFNVYNLIPTIFVFLLVIALLKTKKIYGLGLSILIVLIGLVSIILKINWFSFVLSILVFAATLYYNELKNRRNMNIVFISMYAIVFSMILISEYSNARPNYFSYLFIIVMIVVMVYDVFAFMHKKFVTVLLIVFFLLVCISDIYVYSIIGQISRTRLNHINNCKTNSCKVLKMKEIPTKYYLYHMDINSPKDDSYFAYKSFVNYYHLPKDIEISFYK